MGMRREDYAPLSLQDELTGLRNRRSLLKQLAGRVPPAIDAPAVALLLLDIDGFRQVNDQLGRARGDQYLKDFAERLRVGTGEGDAAARFGGDAFALVLSGRTKDEAGVYAERFLESLGETPLLTPQEKMKANPTVSVGVAAPPGDGSKPDALVEAAARALLAAKRSGKGKVGIAGKYDEALLAERTALDALASPPFLGRTVELEAADRLIEDLRRRKSTFLRVEGEPGAGKTRFLREIGKRAEMAGIRTISLAGAESRRLVPGGPLLAAFHRHYASRPEAIEALQRRFSPAQRTLLAELVPAFSAWRSEKGTPPPNDPALTADTLREAALTLAGRDPLLLLIDDVLHVDRGTLDLLLALTRDSEVTIGAALALTGDARSLRPDRDKALAEFIVELEKSLRMQSIVLSALPLPDVMRLIDEILPGGPPPAVFADQLAKASRGIPLQLTETVRSMILRRRMQPAGKGWKIAPIERGDLAGSVDEVLKTLFEALPAETGELLSRACVLGAQLDLPTLQEVLGQHEAAVLDGVDRMAEAGILRRVPGGTTDDWEFGSTRMREYRYGSLPDDTKMRIHRRVAGVLRLRAVDQAGVRAEMVFHAQMARGAFALPEIEESTEPAKPSRQPRLAEAAAQLSPAETEMAIAFMDAFKGYVRIRRMYPQWGQVADTYREKAWAAWTALAAKVPRVTISTAPREVRLNGQAHAVDSFTTLPEFRLLLVDRLVGTVTFGAGLDGAEFDALVGGFVAPMDKATAAPDHWDQIMDASGVRHADVAQRRYVARESETAAVRLTGIAPERLLRGEDLRLFWRAMRFLTGAAENLRLYPPGQELTDAAFGAASASVEELLDQAGRITVVRGGEGILVNGMVAPTDEAPEAAAFLADELRNKELGGFSLLNGIPSDELRVLVCVLAVADPVTAETIMAANRTRHLVFKPAETEQKRERISDMHLPTAAHGGAEGEFSPDSEAEPIPIGPVKSGSGYLVIRVDLRARACLVSPVEYFLSERSEKELPLMIETLRFGDLEDLANALVARLGACLAEPEAQWRRRAILIATRLLADASGESRDQILSGLREPLQACLLSETDRDALRLLSEVVRGWAKGAIETRRLPLLAGFFMQGVRPKLESAGTPREFKIALQSKLQTLAAGGGANPVVDMLKTSPEPLRRMAVQILSMLGSPLIPTLVEIVCGHTNSDVRRAAAGTLKEIGGTAQQDLSRVVRADAPAIRALRVLEVLELAGPGNIATPVYEALLHADPAVAKEAVKLVKRVERPVTVATLRWVLMKEDVKVRLAALDMVRDLKLTDLGGEVARLAQNSTDETLLRSACRTLVAVPTPSALPALRRIFEQKDRAFGFVKGFSEDTRAAAIAAAAVINHPEARELVSKAASDKSVAVRTMAEKVTKRKE
jgi:diguanylate cyclase (GGDEF)-like protein